MERLRCSRGFVLVAIVVLLAAMGTSSPVRATSILLGPADPMAVDQPRVAVELYTPVPEHSLGPSLSNLWLLDTGAQGLIAVGYAVEEMEAEGYLTESTFYELGIGGLSLYDVSAVYHFDFAGAGGQRQTIPDARILSNGEINYGGFGGIVGMPGMVNLVTSLDMVNMLGEDSEWGLEFDYMGVDFGPELPHPWPSRYSAAVDLVDFPPPVSDPDDPMLPTYGPLPFVNVRLRQGLERSGGRFVLDTGAQVSMLSTAVAFELGLDTDGNGSFAEEAVGETEFMGASGSITVYLLAVEKLVLPTREGVDLIWTDLELPVYDIDPAIAGIFGSDLLTTGWFRAVFETREHGAFDQVHMDFTDPESGEGVMYLDVNPAYDQLVETISIPGDADEDGDVDLNDFFLLKKCFGIEGASWGDGDFDANGTADLSDFVILKSHFGTTAP